MADQSLIERIRILEFKLCKTVEEACRLLDQIRDDVHHEVRQRDHEPLRRDGASKHNPPDEA